MPLVMSGSLACLAIMGASEGWRGRMMTLDRVRIGTGRGVEEEDFEEDCSVEEAILPIL